MALSTTSSVQSTATPAPADQSVLTSDAAMLLMGALAGAAMTKATRKQYRALSRKMAWQALGLRFKSLFGKKNNDIPAEIAGMPSWLFLVLVVAAAAIGIWLFGLLGFLIVLGLGVIIYLLLQKD
jgi:hypothetical protein